MLGARDCWSCGDYPVELRALRNRFPHLVTLLVGSDDDVDVLREYFDRYRIGTDAMLDPGRSLLRQLEAHLGRALRSRRVLGPLIAASTVQPLRPG